MSSTPRGIFLDHWAACETCQEGLPCTEGDPLWQAMNEAEEEEVRDA